MRTVFVFFLLLFLVGCTGPQQLGMSKTQWQALDPNERKALLQDYQQIKEKGKLPHKVYAGPELNVRLSHGTAMMPPFNQHFNFMTTHFMIVPGQCKPVRLQSLDNKNYVDLEACYNGLRLSLDPSRFIVEKSRGTVYFDYNPIWKRGFTYFHVESTGYVRLQDTNVKIKTELKLTSVADDSISSH